MSTYLAADRSRVIHVSEHKPIFGWHFLDWEITPDKKRAVLILRGGKHAPKAGETISVDLPVTKCRNGLHASKRIEDALGFAGLSGTYLTRVKLWGQVDMGHDKLAAQHRQILYGFESTPLFRRLLIDLATMTFDRSDGFKYISPYHDACRSAELKKTADKIMAFAKEVGPVLPILPRGYYSNVFSREGTDPWMTPEQNARYKYVLDLTQGMPTTWDYRTDDLSTVIPSSNAAHSLYCMLQRKQFRDSACKALDEVNLFIENEIIEHAKSLGIYREDR